MTYMIDMNMQTIRAAYRELRENPPPPHSVRAYELAHALCLAVHAEIVRRAAVLVQAGAEVQNFLIDKAAEPMMAGEAEVAPGIRWRHVRSFLIPKGAPVTSVTDTGYFGAHPMIEGAAAVPSAPELHERAWFSGGRVEVWGPQLACAALDHAAGHCADADLPKLADYLAPIEQQHGHDLRDDPAPTNAPALN